jgi:ubiquinone/menaquinone biosynthesis C-methylase UbiE
MSDLFIVSAKLKDAFDAARTDAFRELVALVVKDANNGATLMSCDAGVALLRFGDAAKAHATADVLLGKALAASSSGYAIKPLSLSIHGGEGQTEGGLLLPALALADEMGANEIAISPEAYERLNLLDRDTYRPEELSRTRRFRRRFATGTEPCFVISPIGRAGSDERARADFVFDQYVKRGCAELNFKPYRSDQEFSKAVRRDLMTSITRAKLVIAYLGKPPWNPNVMIEIGYRQAAGGALVVFRDAETEADKEHPLPFDIGDMQVLSLPAADDERDPALVKTIAAKIASAVTKSLATVPVPTSSRHPFMVIEIDRRRDGEAQHVIRVATPEAEKLFAHDGRLVGAKVSDVVVKLQQYMPVGQFMAFATEQTEIIEDLTSATGPLFGVKRPRLNAMIPMVFEGHPNPAYDQRAFLPIIVHSDNSQDDRLLLNVLYLDVTAATRVKDGTFRCVLEAEERSALVWDNYAVSYDKILTRLSIYTEVLKRHVGAMSSDDIRTVLDVGSGTGNATIPLLRAGKSVTAVERSAGMRDLMRRKVVDLEDARLFVYEESAERLPFAAERFDGVTILLALFAMERPLRALNEALRVLRPGGQLVLTEPKSTFQLAPLLAFAEGELETSGYLDELENDWKRVSAVNRRIDPGAGPKLPVEQIVKTLRDRNFVDIRCEDSHLGNCQTVWARKPK